MTTFQLSVISRLRSAEQNGNTPTSNQRRAINTNQRSSGTNSSQSP